MRQEHRLRGAHYSPSSLLRWPSRALPGAEGVNGRQHTRPMLQFACAHALQIISSPKGERFGPSPQRTLMKLSDACSASFPTHCGKTDREKVHRPSAVAIAAIIQTHNHSFCDGICTKLATNSRDSTLRSVVMCHLPPRAAGTPREFNF